MTNRQRSRQRASDSEALPGFRPERALAHPTWWAALSLLVVNDHLLKGAHVLPSWLTGKLSDFAGLFLAPALVAALVRARSPRFIAACHVGVGVVFALLEILPPAAALWRALLGAVGIPWHAWADPTDLCALPAILLAHRLLVPSMRPEAGRVVAAWRAALQGAGALIGTLSVMATAAHRPASTPAPGNGDAILADVFVHVPKGAGEISLSVRPLRPNAVVDCAHALSEPASVLHPDLFETATTGGVLFEDENAALLSPKEPGSVPARACQIVMLRLEESTWFSIGSDAMEWAYVAWNTRQIPIKPIPKKGEPSVPGALVVGPYPAGGLTLDVKGPIRVSRVAPPAH